MLCFPSNKHNVLWNRCHREPLWETVEQMSLQQHFQNLTLYSCLSYPQSFGYNTMYKGQNDAKNIIP